MPLTAHQTKRLTALQHYGTAYEAVVIHPNGTTVRLAYTYRHSFRGLQDVLIKYAEKVIAFLGDDPKPYAVHNGKRRTITISGGGVVKFSGRTERQAIQEGELEWIGKSPKAIPPAPAPIAAAAPAAEQAELFA